MVYDIAEEPTKMSYRLDVVTPVWDGKERYWTLARIGEEDSGSWMHQHSLEVKYRHIHRLVHWRNFQCRREVACMWNTFRMEAEVVFAAEKKERVKSNKGFILCAGSSSGSWEEKQGNEIAPGARHHSGPNWEEAYCEQRGEVSPGWTDTAAHGVVRDMADAEDCLGPRCKRLWRKSFPRRLPNS